MRVRWVWAFLDLPEEGFDEAVDYWSSATATVVSPRRGDREEFATLLPAEGSAWVKAKGGRVLTEAEESCVVYGMPRSVVEAGLSDKSVAISGMADAIMECL